MTAGLNQTVQELQQLLHSVNRQLTKGHERVQAFMILQTYWLSMSKCAALSLHLLNIAYFFLRFRMVGINYTLIMNFS